MEFLEYLGYLESLIYVYVNGLSPGLPFVELQRHVMSPNYYFYYYYNYFPKQIITKTMTKLSIRAVGSLELIS